METAVKEITLVIFTTLAPAGILGLIFVAIAILLSNDEDRACRLSRCLVVPSALAVVGLIASATHLGTPANALYVISGIGRSPLSNEVTSVVVFFALAGVYWIASFRDKPRGRLSRAWLVATIVSGLVGIWFISTAYTVSTIPTWSLLQAQASLWLNGLSAAPAVATLTMICARVSPSRKTLILFAATTGLSALANAAVLFSEFGALDMIKTTTTAASDLVPGFVAAIAAYLVLELIVAISLLLFSPLPPFRDFFKTHQNQSMGLGISATILVCVASFIIRFYFYSLYMTVGV